MAQKVKGLNEGEEGVGVTTATILTTPLPDNDVDADALRKETPDILEARVTTVAPNPEQIDEGEALDIAQREVRRLADLKSNGGLVMTSMLENNMDRTDLRTRPGYHQTWKREDEMDEARGMGYTFIRRQAVKDKVTGLPIPRQYLGKETGEIVKLPEGINKFIVAMEIPQELYDHHQQVVAYKSKNAYEPQEEAVRALTEDFNRATGSRKEVVSSKLTYENSYEELLPARKR